LTAQQRRVYARFMAAYAAYLQYGDEQIGKVLDYLHSSGLDKNTLVVLFSDNGAASETKTGGFRRPYGDQTTLAEMDQYLDEMGTPTTQPLYPRPWAYSGGTPFRRYKLWPYLGGIRTPLMVEWPGRIADPGAIRQQFVHVIDIAPTLLDAAGAPFDDAIGGRRQIPIAGKSFLATLRNARARSPRTVQFFELWGNRAITSGEWRAVAMHTLGTSFEKDQWQLFNTQADPSETTDLARANPAKLKKMQVLWQTEAAKYGGVLREAPEVRAQGFADGLEK
jgi:arylsulfatase